MPAELGRAVSRSAPKAPVPISRGSGTTPDYPFPQNHQLPYEETIYMPPTARHKLNSAHVIAAVVIASIIGVVTGSWFAFLFAARILDLPVDQFRRHPAEWRTLTTHAGFPVGPRFAGPEKLPSALPF